MDRREYLAGVVAAALAGCSSEADNPADETTESGGTATATGTPTAAETGTPTATETVETTAAEAGSTPETPYTATLAPAGEVTFESEPQSVFTVMQPHAEMALLLGRGADVNAVYAPGYVDSLLNALTPRLDGVSVDWADLPRSWNPDKEKLYELDSDVHLADPARVVTMGDWDHSDVVEIREEIAPWFGNTFSANHETPPEPYADDYQYYGLWEIFERVSKVFREGDRYGALASVHADLVSRIESDLPPEEERPSVAMILPSTTDDSMWAYRTNAPGYFAAHTRPLGAVDAMAAAGVETGAKVDYETLLEADPDVLVVLGGIVDFHDMPAVREKMADDPVASEVTAVDEGRIYAQATRHQGPLVNLFQLEMGAKQLYPDRFGRWPTYESGPYPELGADERLFDYDRLAAVAAGDD